MRRPFFARFPRPWWVALALAVLAAGARGTEPLVFYPDWFPGAQFAGLYLAIDRGYFRAVGLDVTLAPFAYGQRADELIAGHPETAAAASIEGYILLQKRAQGARWLAFGAVLQPSPAGYLSLAENPVRDAADLKGKTVGVHRYGDPLYHYFLARAHVPEDSSRMVFVQSGLRDLTTGEVAAVQGFATEEFVQLQREVGARARFVSFTQLGFDSYSQVLVTLPGQAEQHADALRRFLSALRRGWTDVWELPEAAVAAVRTRVGAGGDDALLRAALQALRPYVLGADGTPLLPLDRAKLARMGAAGVALGFRKEAEPVDAGLIDLER